MNATVRPFSSQRDYELMIDYFLGADQGFLRAMGVDTGRLPTKEAWLERVLPDLERTDREKLTCHLSWLLDGQAVGHSNISHIRYGEEAFIHLHLWAPASRRAGLGTEFFKRSANAFMVRFRLKRLFCEPYAENPAPNGVLRKLGFRFIEKRRKVPGWINFEQEVNRYELDHELA